MPLLDVSDVLSSPELVDTTLSVARQAQTVDATGNATNVPVTIKFSGVVTMERGQRLGRSDASSRLDATITIITKFRLIDGASGNPADVVSWHGRTYTVTHVDDYTAYGQGFIQATAEQIPLT